ncbi:hypothetical protein [Methanococcoides burtonii]|uniref:hypothetical protein n=1 Tax=Methanococcoides burtonii TaxID=29291 RepID=UPI00064E5474|nr:hypothetical protein [Methanococcoides burtonii]
MLDQLEEDEVLGMLENFDCRRETFIEDFVKNKSIHSEKMGNTKSYFILDGNRDELCILGYYALTLKVICLPELTKKQAKKLHLKNPEDKYLPTYYIALLAKNDTYKDQIKGKNILNSALNKIGEAVKCVGGRAVWVEAKKKNDGVFNFYTSNGFQEFQVEEQEDGQYSHLLRVVKC